MSYTNKFHLPEVFERFSQANKHTRAGAKYSVTELIDSPLIPRLKKRNQEDIEVDISDRIMSILGTAVHNILEQGAPPDSVVEQRLSTEVDGVLLSGQMDLMTPEGDGWMISDYKTCRGIALRMNPKGKREWESQLNSYALIATDNGYSVTSLEVVAIVRDWNKAEADRSPDYPQQSVVRIPVTLWDVEYQRKFLSRRMEMHEAESDTPCTPEEMWERPARWAVHKRKANGELGKRAYRVYDSRSEADLLAAEIFTGRSDSSVSGEVLKRPGQRGRCAGDYCDVSKHCHSWRVFNETTNKERE